jgi:hypothetical protein
MKKLTYLLPVLLMACGGTPQDDVIVDGPVVVENTSGLEERLPDTCMLSNYAGSEGQDVSTVIMPDGVITRVIRPGEIVSQVYVAERVNFHVDANGIVTRVICG